MTATLLLVLSEFKKPCCEILCSIPLENSIFIWFIYVCMSWATNAQYTYMPNICIIIEKKSCSYSHIDLTAYCYWLHTGHYTTIYNGPFDNFVNLLICGHFCLPLPYQNYLILYFSECKSLRFIIIICLKTVRILNFCPRWRRR